MKIVVTLDGSNYANRAATYAIQLAKKLQEPRIEAITVFDYDAIKREHLSSQTSIVYGEQRRHIFSDVVKEAKRLNIEVKETVLKGDPSEEIIRYVKAIDADLVIMGRRGLNTLQEMVLGSVSQSVMKHIHCPITIVK